MIVKGYLKEFHKTAKIQTDFLNQIFQKDTTVIGLEPSVCISFRDEYKKAGLTIQGKVQLMNEWLLQFHQLF